MHKNAPSSRVLDVNELFGIVASNYLLIIVGYTLHANSF